MRIVCAAGVLWCAAVFAAPGDIPPPPRGQWVVDQTGKLSSSTVGELNRIATEVDAAGAGQLGVLVVQTTSGVRPRDFATRVFNQWGVGHGDTSDGVLLFIALGDRKSEIILGEGSQVTTDDTDVVMADDVVANMKRNDLDGAVTSAASSLDRLMRQAVGQGEQPDTTDNTGLGPDAYVTPARTEVDQDELLAPYAQGERSFPERSPRTWVVDLADALTASQRAQLDVAASDVYASNQGRIFFLVVNSTAVWPSLELLANRFVRQVQPLSALPVAVVVLSVGAPGAFLHVPAHDGWEQQQVREEEARMAQAATVDRVAALVSGQRFAQVALTSGIPPRPMAAVLSEGMEEHQGAVLVSLGGLLSGAVALILRWNRRRVRVCTGCDHPRQLLGDATEGEHLDTSQNKEQSIGSVDYDVWWCGRCRDVLVLRYGAFFSSYSKCAQCSARTLGSTSTTLSHATEYSTGSVRVDEACVNCTYKNSYTRTTARLSRSRSSSSSSRSSSSSSYSGGRSSGRGSSGSW